MVWGLGESNRSLLSGRKGDSQNVAEILAYILSYIAEKLLK